jgi:GT2 family glycosyltransferase
MLAEIISFPKDSLKPRISVIMVSYMTGPALFEAIMAVMDDHDIIELILVDNGNDVQTRLKLGELQQRYDRLRLIQGHGNIGFSKANNLGASFANGEYLLFLNPDAILIAGTPQKLVACGRNLTAPWVVGAMLRLTNGKEQRGARRKMLTPWSAIVSFSPLHKLPMFKSIHRESDVVPDQPVNIPVVSGACMMMNRVSFNAIGGFDEDYFLHVEDIDLCRRVGDAGGQVFFVPDADVTHYGSTSRVRHRTVEWEKTKGFITYFRKHAKTKLGRIGAGFASPFIVFAIMGRAWWIALRAFIFGR